ncbi:MAG: hypothetical protein WD036_02830 [Bauldia sp.]
MADAMALYAEVGAWNLAALADRRAFDSHYEAVAGAIADRLTAKVHIDIQARGRAFDEWIVGLASMDAQEITDRHFVGVCASLIASLASHPIVTYSVMVRPWPDRLIEAVAKYPDQVTALMSGAAVYLLRVRDMTGVDPSVPLSPLIVENAAGHLWRGLAAAARFRELLQLSSPWS